MATTHPVRAGRAYAFAGRLVDVVLLGVIALGLTSIVLGRVLPAIGHPVFVVAGPSMVPALPVGAAIALDAVDPAALEVGDVVTLRTGPDRSVFTHRITRLVDREDGRWIETQGDANPHPDPALTSVAAVIGKVGLHVPYAGYLLTLVSTIQGIVLLVSTGLGLLLLGWCLDDMATDRRRRAARARVAPPAAMPQPEPAAPIVMPARAAAAMRPATKRRSRTRHGTADRPSTAPAIAGSAAGTVSAAELLRADPDGRRRRRRSELARSRP